MYDDTATNDSAGDEDKRVPTFCLIKGIPACINFDEKSLRIALKKQTTGFRKCMMMSVSDVQEQQQQNQNVLQQDSSSSSSLQLMNETLAKTYALALFESKEAALDAAEPEKVQLIYQDPTDSSSSSTKSAFLTIIPMQGDKAVAPEATFKETLTIDGEEIPKIDLADTTGLSSALKSFAGFRETVTLEKGPGGIAKWCKSTKKGEDCPFGNQCWYIHLKKYQKTIIPKFVPNNNNNTGDGTAAFSSSSSGTTRRDREDEEENVAGENTIQQDKNEEYYQQLSSVLVPKGACEAMRRLTTSANSSISMDWRLPGGRTIQLPRKEIEDVFIHNNINSEETLKQQIQTQMNEMNSSSSFFVKFDFPHGSASDLRLKKWISSSSSSSSLYQGTESTPKPIKRDVLMHSCMKESQKSFSVKDATEAISLLKNSLKAKNALKKYLRHLDAGSFSTNNNNKNEIPFRIDFYQESLWCPPSQYSILLKTSSSSNNNNNNKQLFCGAAQRIDWMIVDVANRRFENPPEVTAQQQLATEQKDTANDWRQISMDSLKEVIENLDLSSSSTSSNHYFCINVAVPGQTDDSSSSKPKYYMNLDANTISKPKILSIHDADESIRKSALLPYCGKSAASFRITWRTRTPFPEQVPRPIQEILEKYGHTSSNNGTAN